MVNSLVDGYRIAFTHHQPTIFVGGRDNLSLVDITLLATIRLAKGRKGSRSAGGDAHDNGGKCPHSGVWLVSFQKQNQNRGLKLLSSYCDALHTGKRISSQGEIENCCLCTPWTGEIMQEKFA
jgi:hypothetical protein